MAGNNLPTNRRFKFEDYKDAPEWFASFLSSLNLFTDPIYQIIDGGIGYQNLMIPQLFTKTFTAPATGLVTFSFVNPLAIGPSSVVIGNLYENTTPSIHPADATTVYWHFSLGTIYVDDIPNLTSGTTYVVTFSVS